LLGLLFGHEDGGDLKNVAPKTLIATSFMLVSYLAYFSILKMEVVFISETSGEFE
jgi:hypothetical protein